METKKISIVMPVYNGERFLSEALESIANQTYKRYELIIVDGGSTDSTLEILKSYSSIVSKIIPGPDQGVADALNKGFDSCCGDILCWVNADDVYINSNALGLAQEAFSDGKTHLAYGHCASIDECGIVKKASLAWQIEADDYKHGSNIFTGSVFFSSRAWRSFGGFDLKYKVIFEYQILDFLLRANRVKVINDYIGALRRYPGTLSDRLSGEIEKEMFLLWGKFDRASYLSVARRVIALANQKMLARMWRNKFYDELKGCHWRDIYNKTSVLQAI